MGRAGRPFCLSMNILITGGTGSLGSALTKKWIDEGHSLTIISRDDHKQLAMRQVWPQIKFHSLDLGDAGASRRLLDASEGQDYCIHAAAAKYVSMGEYQPFAYLNTNVMGTLYLLQAWKQMHGDCSKFLLISSDKGIEPLNLYGGSKHVASSLVRAPGYDGSILRYGNVVGSNGSFLSAWKRQANLGQSILVKQGQPNGEFPTRFFLTMDGAVELVEAALQLMAKGEGGVFLPPNLPAFSVMDVAKATGLSYQVVGIEPAEKLHEVLLARGEGWETTGSLKLVRRVLCYWGRDSYYLPFKSDTALRMTGKAVLEAMAWSPG